MGIITKKDLVYEYSWTVYGDDDPKITGIPDSTLLNRKEGYEVLSFINRYCEIEGLTKTESALQVEFMITEAPSAKRSHANIHEWIKYNWQDY